MRREGSAFSGLGVVMLKELSDHLTSVRMRVLEWLVVLVAIAALWGAIQQIKETTAEDPFLFLRLFTTSREPLLPNWAMKPTPQASWSTSGWEREGRMIHN